MSDSLWAYGLLPARILCPWDFPGKNIGVGCHFLLQEIFPTQGLNPGLPHCRHCRCFTTWATREVHHHSFTSVQFSHSVVANSLRPHESQHTRGVHHQLLELTQTHVHWVSDAIQSSHPLSSPSPPAPNPSQHQSLSQWLNSSHEVAKVLEFQL